MVSIWHSLSWPPADGAGVGPASSVRGIGPRRAAATPFSITYPDVDDIQDSEGAVCTRPGQCSRNRYFFFDRERTAEGVAWWHVAELMRLLVNRRCRPNYKDSPSRPSETGRMKLLVWLCLQPPVGAVSHAVLGYK